MTAVKGTLYRVFATTGIVSTATAAGDKLAAMKNATFNIDCDLPDVTTMDSAGWSEFLAGVKTWSIDFSGIWDEALVASAVSPTEIIADLIAGNTAKKFAFIPLALGTTIPGWMGLGFYKNIKITAENEQGCPVSGSIQGTGVLAVFTA